MFKSLFDSKSVQGIETWVGTFNKNKRKFSVAVNRDRASCTLNIEHGSMSLMNLSPIKYIGGDVSGMADYIEASCSIPGLVAHKTIEESADGEEQAGYAHR